MVVTVRIPTPRCKITAGQEAVEQASVIPAIAGGRA